GALGVTPLRATFGEVVFVGAEVSWLLPAGVLLGGPVAEVRGSRASRLPT
ncbi:EamA family transporter, partial [Rathayibacter sp. AY1G1]